MEGHVRSHQLVQQNRRRKKAYVYSCWHKGLLPVNIQISPTKSPWVCQNKSIYKPIRRKDYLSFLLFKDQETWIKKGGELFDDTMGAYDDSEICGLVELFILFKFHQLNKIKHLGLYRDDELAVVKNMSGPQSQKVKKELLEIWFKFNYWM